MLFQKMMSCICNIYDVFKDKKMKDFNICLLVCLFLSLFSCSRNANQDVERVDVTLQVVSDDLITSMPGALLVYENELIWEDATSEGSIHVINRKNGEEIKEIQLRGEGPEEVVTPGISWAPDRKFIVYDYNGAKQIFISLNELSKSEVVKKEVLALDNQFRGLKPIRLVDHQTVFVASDSPLPFWQVSDSIVFPFGHYPLVEAKDIDNKFEVLQGEVVYNPYTGRLLHSIDQLAYMALYKWTDGKFVLDREKEISKIDYSLSGKRLIVKDIPKHAPTAIAITKDYIISIERDEANTSLSVPKGTGVGRRFSKAPQTVFVYDYDLNLKKIVDVGMPVFRIAADCSSNEVYLIGVNPEFCIVTFKIP